MCPSLLTDTRPSLVRRFRANVTAGLVTESQCASVAGITVWPSASASAMGFSPNVSQGGRGAAKSSSIRQRSELNIRKSSYGPSPADLLAVLSPNVSIFCQGKTEHSPNRPAYPNSSGYSLPFSSAELRLATAGAPGGTAP